MNITLTDIKKAGEQIGASLTEKQLSSLLERAKEEQPKNLEDWLENLVYPRNTPCWL